MLGNGIGVDVGVFIGVAVATTVNDSQGLVAPRFLGGPLSLLYTAW
jgi:hypothetical protein